MKLLFGGCYLQVHYTYLLQLRSRFCFGGNMTIRTAPGSAAIVGNMQ